MNHPTPPTTPATPQIVPQVVTQIDHVELLVEDLEAAVAWYRRVLGLAEVGRFNPHPIMIGVGGTMLALFARGLTQASGSGQQPAAEPPPGFFRRVAWRVDQEGFVRAQAHLQSQGVPFTGPVDHAVSWSIYFADPDGHPLEITTYFDPSYPWGGRKES